ncbi:hypothetical protein AI2BBH_13910 [Alistipes indistinctus]|nr:hypothetical protein AI2BBH_13910 [Alistipes indistinctus]
MNHITYKDVDMRDETPRKGGMLTRSCVRLGWLVLGVGLFMCSCSKEPAESFAGGDPTSPIVPEAEARMTVESRADLSGVVSGTAFPAGTAKVFSVVGYSGTAVPTAWSSPYIPNVAVNSGAGSALSFATPQYYPANGNKVYFYAYSPVSGTYTAGSGSTAPKVKWTITGGQDIMWAKVDNGIAKAVTGSQRQPVFAFTHLLKQVKFKVVKDASFEDNIKLTSLKIIGARTKASLALNTGTLSWETATGELIAYDNTSGQAITSTATSAGSAVMMEPGASFKVRAVAGGVTYADVTVTLGGTNAGAAGLSQEVTLTFKHREIAATATVAEWTDGGETASGESSVFPYVLEGKILVMRDEVGSADPDSYSFHQPWTTTPAHRESSWIANVSGYNTVAERFEVAAADMPNRHGNSENCSAYSQASDDAGTWRVPTIVELQLIVKLFKAGKLPGVATVVASGDVCYWSATGDANDGSRTWAVKPATLSVSNRANGNQFPTRCIRDIYRTLPYVIGGNTIVMKDLTAAADPLLYPRHEERWTETPAHRETSWDSGFPDNKSGYNTVGERFEVASTDAGEMSWTDAQTACASYRGQAGWRLPTMNEWRAIHFLKGNLTAANLPSTGMFWAATEYSDANGWNLAIASGSCSPTSNKQTRMKVRCVREIFQRALPYVMGGNTIVVMDLMAMADPALYPVHEKWTTTPEHKEVGLTSNTSGYNTCGASFEVARNDVKVNSMWPSPLTDCATYSQEPGDEGTWRLPTCNELRLIYTMRNSLGAIDGFTASNGRYWSATQSQYNQGVRVDFTNGEVRGNNSPNGTLPVRCVRDI